LAKIWDSPCDYAHYQSLSKECSFQTETPQIIFETEVWGSSGRQIPAEIGEIQGAEGRVPFSNGPAFVRFRASSSVITKILTNGYGKNPYEIISCDVFYRIGSSQYLIQRFPEEFDWWRPAEVISPVCYSAQGMQGDDVKYLLIAPDSTVYFYRTATCGLCPD
jgi:hypothetical protein